MSLPFSEVGPSLELNSDQSNLLAEFKQWVEEKADFFGRSEEDFLVLFLRSCDFDIELSKKTLRLYYKARLHNPQWWKNRDLNLPQIQFLIKARIGCVFLDQDPNYPTVGVLQLACIGPDSSIMGPVGKFYSCAVDMIARRRNCQLNGAILIINMDNMPWWMVRQALWPPFLMNIFNSFLYCLPIQVQMMVLVNVPSLASTAVNIIRSFLPEVLKNKVQCCKRWSDIGQFVPLEILPDECGGTAGPIKVHEDASVNELLAMKDYFFDDNKYGFQA